VTFFSSLFRLGLEKRGGFEWRVDLRLLSG
jgi:hypothetical protein